jgi:hypothetical protein
MSVGEGLRFALKARAPGGVDSTEASISWWSGAVRAQLATLEGRSNDL